MSDIVKMLRAPTGCVPPTKWELAAADEIERLRAALATTLSGDYEHGYSDGVEWATVHAATSATPAVGGEDEPGYGGRYGLQRRPLVAETGDTDALAVPAVGGEPPYWLWYGKDANGKTVITFGRWPKSGAKWRYKLAEIQPTEHDHPKRPVAFRVPRADPATAMTDVVRETLINAIDSPTVEALARVWTLRSDKSCSEQIVEILALRLAALAATPAVGGERENLLAKAAQDFIDKVDRGAARSEQSYAAFKTALAATPAVGGERERIARLVCCGQRGCQFAGDSEDGEKCWCDTTDFNNSGIEKTVDALLALAQSASPLRGRDDKALAEELWAKLCTDCAHFNEPEKCDCLDDILDAFASIRSAAPPEQLSNANDGQIK